MPNLKALLVVVSACWLSACAAGQSGDSAPKTLQPADLAKVFSVKSTFGPQFRVVTAGPTGIDPKLLAPQKLPQGVVFEPADCAKYAAGETLPPGLKGNMAAVSAEGEGNRFIAMAIETSDTVPFDSAGAANCKHFTFAGQDIRGVVDVVDSPQIDEAQTLGTHRQLQTTVGGAARTGELYNYVAYLGDYLVIVTANPLVLPDKPVAPVNTEQARGLLAASVNAIRG
jgi:hypothetical protein